MSNNKYLLGTVLVISVLGVSFTAFQTTGKFDGFAAYAQTTPKTADSEKLLMDPQFRQQIVDTMKKNHEIAQDVIMAMINDPALRLQLLGHLTENKESMQDLMKLFGQNGASVDMKMVQSSMDHGSMSMKKDSMKKETKKDATKKDSVKTDSGMMDHNSMSKSQMKDMKMSTAGVEFGNIKVTSVSSDSATIQGTTNQAVKCQIEYWTAKDSKHYFAADSGDMMDMKHTDHKVTIKNLMPDTKYSYKFKATLDGMTFYSSQKIFTTKAS